MQRSPAVTLLVIAFLFIPTSAVVTLIPAENLKSEVDTSKDVAVVPAATTTTTTTTIEYIGHSNTPIVINVLSEQAFLSLPEDLRSRTDFSEGHENDVAFRIIDRPIVNPFIEVVLANKDVLKHFPKKIFEQREFVCGYSSWLCNQSCVHSDYLEHEFMGDVVAPAADKNDHDNNYVSAISTADDDSSSSLTTTTTATTTTITTDDSMGKEKGK